MIAVVALVAATISGAGGAIRPKPSPELQRAVGAYQFQDGSVVALFIQPFGTSLRIIDYDTGAMRQLEQVSRDAFVGDPRLLESSPVQLRVQFVRNAGGQIVASDSRRRRTPTSTRHSAASATTDRPESDIRALTIPTLWQYGDVDKRQYIPESVAILADAAPSATVRVYAGSAHSLRATTNGLISEERDTTGFVPELFADLAAWLQAR
jgi:pimeloyl-ACP methyl ester carboxylesterase